METRSSVSFLTAARSIAPVRRHLAGFALAALVLGSAAAPASAALARAPLFRIAGEDPTIVGSAPAFVAAGDVRQLDAANLKVTLSNLDAARFPVGCAAEVVAGSYSAKGVPLTLMVASPTVSVNPLGPTTQVDVKAAGVIQPGQTASVKINCQFIDANGVQQKHSTEWQGKF